MPLESVFEDNFDVIQERQKLREDVPVTQIMQFITYCMEKHWRMNLEMIKGLKDEFWYEEE